MAKKEKKGAPRGDVTVKVDPKLKKLYDDLTSVIAAASRKEAQDFERRWQAADGIVSHDPPLYVFGGYEDEDAFFREVMEEEPRNARRYLRVARFCTAQDEIDYGSTKLDAALGLIEAKIGRPLEHTPLPIALARLRVPVGKKTVDLANATVAQVTAATAKLTSASHKRTPSPARAALLAELGKVASLRDVVVREHGGLLTFEHVPLAAVRHFVGALTRAKLPT